MITLASKAKRTKTFIITIAFTDSAGNSVVPNWAKWTLTDINGNIINLRSNIDIVPIAQTVEVVLSGADLATPALVDYFDSNRRKFKVDAEYDSIVYGDDLPFGEIAEFEIED